MHHAVHPHDTNTGSCPAAAYSRMDYINISASLFQQSDRFRTIALELTLQNRPSKLGIWGCVWVTKQPKHNPPAPYWMRRFSELNFYVNLWKKLRKNSHPLGK
jgi:hypothetical protein